MEIDKENKLYRFRCPHCQGLIEVKFEDTNCCIFRHGFISPHAPKEVCDTVTIGCGKPFRLVKDGESYVVEICGYI